MPSITHDCTDAAEPRSFRKQVQHAQREDRHHELHAGGDHRDEHLLDQIGGGLMVA